MTGFRAFCSVIQILPPPPERISDYNLRRWVVDFAGDVSADSTFPDVRSWPELQAYLRACGACDVAVRAGRRAWALYRAEHHS